MPWTPKQPRYLLSSGSPLTSPQQTKMKGELHANPAMGQMKKGYTKSPKPPLNLKTLVRSQ